MDDVTHLTRNQARIAIRDSQDPQKVKKFLQHPNVQIKRYAAHKLINKLAQKASVLSEQMNPPTISPELGKAIAENALSLYSNILDGMVKTSFDHFIEDLSETYGLEKDVVARVVAEETKHGHVDMTAVRRALTAQKKG